MATPRRQRADQRAPEIADAAEHHDHEAVDDVALAQVGRDVVDLAQRHAGEAGNARAEAEGHGVDEGVRMPMADAMRRFCVTARIWRPSGVRFSTSCRTMNTAIGEDHDPEAGSR